MKNTDYLFSRIIFAKETNLYLMNFSLFIFHLKDYDRNIWCQSAQSKKY